MLDVSSETLLRRRRAPRETIVLQAVFHTLAYADVFDYPLTVSEVYRYLTSTRGTLEEVTRALSDESLFSQTGEYFSLRGREEIIEIRGRRAQFAPRLWRKAIRYGQIIASLPFVKMVAVTGSLAMNNTDEGKDIDYLLVTAPNHLWTCRALSLLVARMAKQEGISLCPNYLVTTDALELKERSLYVAHELTQMIPLSGMEIYNKLRQQNAWIAEYLPNAAGAPSLPQGVKPVKSRSATQRILEFFFSLPFGPWFEKWEMNRKIKRLSREQSHSFESYFSADVCKGHVDKHGENVVTALAARLKIMTDPQGTS
ncbi:MAG TPA: hypothetical protein VFG81_01155 [Anaerolineales bacterium]|nr:hypothetical protein [Anaerolineales bacterium]